MLSKTELKESLSKCFARVTFNTSDGTVREMLCTLMSDHLPKNKIDENTRHVPRQENDEILAVWDVDKQAWRSFRIDSITKINYIGVNRV